MSEPRRGYGNEDTMANGNDVNGTHMEKRGICVILGPGGKTMKLFSDDPSDFLTTVEEASITWINFSVDNLDNEGMKIASLLGFSTNLYSTLLKCEDSAYDDRDTEFGLKMPAVTVEGFEVKPSPLLVLMRKGLILTIHTEKIVRFFMFGKYADIFFRKIQKNIPIQDKMTIVLTRIIDENNTRNAEYLKEIDRQAENLNDLLIEQETPGPKMARSIHRVKKMLITYMYSLWASLDVVHTLRYGDAELLTNDPKLLGRISIIGEDITRQIGLTEHMSEVLSSGLEVVQTIYNNQLQQLNNRVTWIAAWLAILSTAAIVPNTIATILSSELWGFQPGNPLHLGIYMALIVFPTLWATFMVYMWVKQFARLPAHRTEVEGREVTTPPEPAKKNIPPKKIKVRKVKKKASDLP